MYSEDFLNNAHHVNVRVHVHAAPSLFDDLPPEAESANKGDETVVLGKRKSQDYVESGNVCSVEVKQPKLTSHCKLRAYIGERRGEREDMQDAHTIIDDFTDQFPALPNNM